ncbi:hypothetical protein C5167_004212 [Papaver somniferum]|nr:hypothetical protein C5167_004212 [Papaver somniferum]
MKRRYCFAQQTEVSTDATINISSATYLKEQHTRPTTLIVDDTQEREEMKIWQKTKPIIPIYS